MIDLFLLSQLRCDLMYGTPTMYVDILDSNPDKFNTSSLIRGIYEKIFLFLFMSRFFIINSHLKVLCPELPVLPH